jgi:hypothetical protein
MEGRSWRFLGLRWPGVRVLLENRRHSQRLETFLPELGRSLALDVFDLGGDLILVLLGREVIPAG